MMVWITSQKRKDIGGKMKSNKRRYSPYSRFFDEYSEHWTKTAEFNLLFLREQQEQANKILHERGYLFLNEVYDMLDMTRTENSDLIGWVLGSKYDVVDFGIYDPKDETKRLFVNGDERSILLDFNVDGNVYDIIRGLDRRKNAMLRIVSKGERK